MMLSSTKLLILTLIGCVATSPIELHERGQNVIIGYRTVAPEQAAQYNKAGTLTDDGNRIGRQLGSGVYTTFGKRDWLGSPKNWFCVIFANPDAIDRVSKAWVPKSYDGEELWFKADKIDSYIKKLESSWDPAKTLRMSIIEGTEHDDLQMLIPPGLLNSNGGGMGITASCKEKIDDIPDQRVNYKDWHNIKGDEQPAFASPVCSFHLTQWDYAEFKDTDGDERYEVEVKLFDDNKTQIGFQPRTKAGNAHPLSMTSKLPTLIVTPEAKNDYIQFNYANEAWPSNGKFGANDVPKCSVGGWDRSNFPSYRQMDCSFKC